MTNKEILEIAMQQSAYDTNAKASDFLMDKNVFVKSEIGPLARKYYKEPIACNLVSYGNNIVASVKDEYREIVENYLSKYEFYHCFETPNMHWLDERMKENGYRVCFMAEYFLPDVNVLKRTAIYFGNWIKTALPINLLFLLLFVQLVYVGIRWYVKGWRETRGYH